MKSEDHREITLIRDGFTVFWSDHARKRLGSRFVKKECTDLPPELVQIIAKNKPDGDCFRLRLGNTVFIFAKLDSVSVLVKTVFPWDGPQKTKRKARGQRPRK